MSNNNEKEAFTVLFMCNVAGDLPPPLIIYSYKRLPKEVVNNVPKSWGIGKSDNGWMTGRSFFEYITNVFLPWIKEKNIPMPIGTLICWWT